MDFFALIATLAAVITAIAVVATYFIYKKQAVLMDAQLELARQQIEDLQASRARQQLYQVIQMLLSIWPEIERVLELSDRDFQDWSGDDLKAAEKVASNFNLVGILAIEEVIPGDLFAKAWYYSVPQCNDILQPFLQSLRATRDPRYFTAFDVLAARVREHSARFEGFKDRARAS